MIKLRYIGQNIGISGLTNGKVYECIEIHFMGFLRIIDDSGEDYLYSDIAPAPATGGQPPGRWEIVEDSKDEFAHHLANLPSKPIYKAW